MPNFDIKKAQTVLVLIRFDSELFKENPNSCIPFSFMDENGNLLCSNNELHNISDPDLIAIEGGLRSVLNNGIYPEIKKRVDFDTLAKKELEIIICSPTRILEVIMSKTMVPFRSKGSKKNIDEEGLLDEGTLGDLCYKIFDRNVIHLYDTSLMFHKDINIFEQELEKLNFSSMKDGDTFTIKGSGDTDKCVFSCVDGEIKISLSRRGFELLEKLQTILKKAHFAKQERD